jgi:hypothetical protein
MKFLKAQYDDHKRSISDERLAELMLRFTPLYRAEGEQDVWKIEIPDLRNTAFTWSPKLTEKVNFEPIRAEFTSHGCGYYGFFKPSIAEVLSHVEDNGNDWGNAFVIAMESVDVYGCGGGHQAVTYFGNI